MRVRGAGLPWEARLLIVAAALLAAACATPAVVQHRGTDWASLLPLAGLYALCEYLPRCPLASHRLPAAMGAHGRPADAPPGGSAPVLLTAVFLLPPEEAALVPLVGGLIGRVEPRHAAARRVWHAAQLALAVVVAASLRELLFAPGAAAFTAEGFSAALIPACLVALACCTVLTLLDCAVLIAAEHRSVHTVRHGQLGRAAIPYLVHGLAGLMMAVLWRSEYGPVAALFVLLPMYISCWVFAQYHGERAAHQTTIRALVQAVDIKDRYTRGHSERVGRASVLIARELGMDEDRTEVLRFAGILHDVGKLGVPTRLLRKDGPLTPQERRIIELHPEYGHEMVRGIGFLGEARSAILHHHERLDGSGYPHGLRGGQIPEPARVVAVADAFDAMTSTRSYRRARPVRAAVEELRKCAGSQFDPRMVRALTRALDRQGWSPAVTADGDGDAEPRTNVPSAQPNGAPPNGAPPDGASPNGEPLKGEPPRGTPLNGLPGTRTEPRAAETPQGPHAGAAAGTGSSAGTGAGSSAEPFGPTA